MVKRILHKLSSIADFIFAIKHLSISQWDVEQTDYSHKLDNIRQQGK